MVMIEALTCVLMWGRFLQVMMQEGQPRRWGVGVWGVGATTPLSMCICPSGCKDNVGPGLTEMP